MANLITQYKGLRRENYILFLGRIVTNMGSMIWPVMTLILTQKLGLTAAQASIYTIVFGAVQLPLSLFAGKLADKYNKKRLIVFFDCISVAFYITCAFIPLNFVTVVILSLGSLFQNMEGPSYDTLIADITTTENREKAYSLSYLGANIGLVASPAIAGFLFKDYLWLSFLISGIAIGTSTILIGLFVKDISVVEEHTEASAYQKALDSDTSIWSILKDNRIILLYIVEMALFWCAYGQWGFLMPIDVAAVHGADAGARIYGLMNSENCILVVLFTPVITQLFIKVFQTGKMVLGSVLVITGYLLFTFGLGHIPVYFLSIALFTFGEIFMTIACGPYTSERIPASHRGRINGVLNIMQSVLSGIAMFAIGNLYTYVGATAAWSLVFGMLGTAFIIGFAVVILDKKKYPKLYSVQKEDSQETD